ncbi:ATPase/histidine kinase/DNA gyrase B/HSP90 domain protein [Streptococcus cristatus ATCC 51100]|uniref:sensor histidine kinase n=1 Tax=Streptococcus cristatus TaxID=45634 RepID=UPI0001F80A86|nr:sensor histidine kinase [Streptococcus cristatus]EFX52936.1 ATPase/histidine kinase/DNA gyrase B/HSP90 domain protein [Streptococcus cristatus ATCC 51100]KJQ57557.1 sensor histidine kinase [Streptococcus cristatus]SQG31773.1 histidine kinase [Streptococcus cristatus ATCC 51100]
MDMQDKFFFLKHHLYSRRFILLLLLIVFSIMGMFAFIFEDGRSLLEYQLLLAFLLASFFLGMDLASAYKEYRNQLFYASGRPQTALEVLLFEKLALLEMDKKNRAIEEREKLNDLMDYYTLWAHQIKTPIAASSLLVGEIEDKKVKNQLEQELFKIESYVNIVLQYLRLESFHEDLVLKKENLEDLVKEIVKKYAIFFIQKGLSLNLHDLDRTIITDRKWFVVILEQVLSNSLKYTSQGGIEIYFQEDTLYIKDSGLGIQDSDLLRVFERGFSGYNGRLTQQSSGLGLYLSKKIADELGHQISIASQVGQGTTVMISFSEKKMIFE